MEFDFRNRIPAPPLDRFVDSIWFARGHIPYAKENIAPTGSVVAVFVLGDPIIQTPNNGHGEPLVARRGFLVGPHVRPAVNEPTGETYALGIVAKPVGCEMCFGIKPANIRGQVVDLEDSWLSARSLRAALMGCNNPEKQLDQIETILKLNVAEPSPDILRCEAAINLLEKEPTRIISQIASEFGVSHSHLDRELARIVGITPRSLSRLLRLKRLLSQIDINETINWADLATKYGWYDQSHFIRDFKRHTGVVPSTYLAAQRKSFSQYNAKDAAGFVPQV